MNNHEEIARENHKKGNNCSVSLHNAFLEDCNLSKDFPMPRSIDGKCGALLTGIKILQETGHEDKIAEFEKEFIDKFGYSKCMDLVRNGRRCNDYIGETAKMLDKILNQ